MKKFNIVKQINPDIFRGYDIRGLMGRDLNEDVYYTLGRGYATFLRKRNIKLCPVGYDNRLNGKIYAAAITKGLNDGGVDCVDIGYSLSQIIYFASYVLKTKGGVIVTASHNSRDFNGAKMGVNYSQTMVTEEIIELRKIIEKGVFSKGRGRTTKKNVFPQYKKQLVSRFNFKKKWKVVIDGCNSTSGLFYPEIFRSAGCQVIEQNTKPNGNFPLGVPDPTDNKVLTRLASGVVKHKADIGLAFDADGDRLAVVDEKGTVLWMDTIVALYAKNILKHNPGAPIVFNTYCSRRVSETIIGNGGKPIMWLVGHSFIKSKVKETKAPFGGELSGHLFFAKDYYSHDDGGYAGLRLLQILEEEKQPLSALVSKLPYYIGSPEIKFGVADNIKFQFVKTKVFKGFKKIWPKAQYTLVDGVRIDTPDTMVSIRASQNGPYLGMKFEAKTKSQYENVKNKLKKFLYSFPDIDWSEGVNIEALD